MTASAIRREKAEGFFDDCCNVGEIVCLVRLCFENRRYCFQVSAEQLIMLSVKLRQGRGIGGQEVKDIAYYTAGRVVTEEHEEADLTGSKGAEFRVQSFRPVLGVSREIGLYHEVDNRFSALAIRSRFVFIISFIRLLADAGVHLTAILSVYEPAYNIQRLQNVCFGVGLVPLDLIEHTVCECVVASLSS